MNWNWHIESIDEVISKLNSDENWLTNQDSLERLKKYGENKLLRIKTFSALKVFFGQFKSFLIIILVVAAILSFFMHSTIDAIVIVAIIVANAILWFVQEYKTEKAIDKLREMMVPEAKVMRNGKLLVMDSTKIVPWDILILQEWDKIMADARIIVSDGLKVNEAALTWESMACEKISKKLNTNVPLADRINMVYQWTTVVSWEARAIVVGTWMKTELWEISGLVQKIKPDINPFKKKLDIFAKNIWVIILILSGLIVWLLLWKWIESFEAFLVAVSLAVSAIPEWLPAVISLWLAFATWRMLKHNVLIRKLPASETLGRTTVICTDKTWTLTEENMKVTSIYANGIQDPSQWKELLLRIWILCNKAKMEEQEDWSWHYFVWDPTEIALIKVAKENFLHKRQLEEQEGKIKEFPFDSDRKMMSIIRISEGKLINYVKWAPERIIEHCKYELINGEKIELNKSSRDRLIKAYEDMAQKWLRVLWFAYKDIDSNKNKDNIKIEDAENDLIFVGFQWLIDPPRSEVRQSIAICKQAWIRVIMITGDSKLTAEAVAKQIWLVWKSIDATDLYKLNDAELLKKIRDITIFSRISPKDKLRIINILKKYWETVAMTWDGVNDALALKRADIWIAMWIRWTDVARDASDIVLLDDNFASIVMWVREWRRIYDNTKKFIKFLMSANFSELVLVSVAISIGLPLPMLPLQILRINLVTDSLPALALSEEEEEADIMNRKPGKQWILSWIKWFMTLAWLLWFGFSFLLFNLYLDDINMARTMAVTTSIIFQMLLVFNCKSQSSILKSPRNKYLFWAVWISIWLHLLAIYTPLWSLFYFVKLSLIDRVYIVWAGFVWFVIMELFKYILRRIKKAKNNKI